MQPWLFILVNMAVAAFVGGLTNHFAIKMLFHPRQAIYLLGKRIPFTPGLIPKRKSQIAESLGDVVASYLVTTEGLRELLEQEKFRQAAADKLNDKLTEIARMEPGLTLQAIGTKYWGEEGWTARKAEWSGTIRDYLHNGLDQVWTNRGWSSRTIAETVPGWSGETIINWSQMAENMIVNALREEILSPRGQRLLRQLASGMLDKAGGFLGALAGIFMDEDKMIERLTPILLEQLGGETVRTAIRGMIAKQLEAAGGWTLEQTVSRFAAGEEPLVWMKLKLDAVLRLEERFEQLEAYDISQWLLRNEDLWRKWVQTVLGASFNLLNRNMHTIIEAIELPSLVKQQVEKFPIERLEHIILSVSGKEFKAITWLGAVLGGLIGLFQSIFILWIM
ncbi:DUF445 domain-containing protein [Paenibacillus sambharensis]|uniref:DUF445 domain-containing protein n=1 Tax=Paenibacillus sambharensis TaxID=1803190 RepID=A0A2W1LGV4_9BACL|nr:DUF445 family protein [Paenibacillus sambharensis]PZD94255.1 DUF445 domain-containing protein [Paenibacillus sambharensis]